ncbi:hypothetical protein ACLB1T_19665 [Escherichia coli]
MKVPAWSSFQVISNRHFDVAIAEQHAVTFAAGLAIGGQTHCRHYPPATRL